MQMFYDFFNIFYKSLSRYHRLHIFCTVHCDLKNALRTACDRKST